MLHLNMQGLQDRAAWAQAGIRLPRYDVAAVRARTWEAPVWLHFGAGNIFRGFLAAAQQTLLNTGRADTGILAAESFDFQIIDQVYSPYDALSLLVRMRADGSEEREVIASVAGGLKADCAGPDWARLTRVFCSPTLQMASFTITEKGYALTDLEKKPLPVVERDLAAGPEGPRHTMSIAAALLYRRFQAGGAPIAMVSMDNCARNGEKLRAGVLSMARGWAERGLVESAFLDWLEDEGRVSFPWSMIDKITPHPSERVQEELGRLGETDEKFLSNVMGQVNDKAAVEKVADTFKMVYTPFHGTGYKLIPEALRRLGMKHVICVPEQMVIDGNFPTVISPNPENPEGFYLAVDLAKKEGADFILGSDPDADRVGIMVRTSDGEFKVLTGNQTGVLLLDYLIGAKQRTGKMPANPVALKTIVTTEMARKVAETNGLKSYDTFTGFKFLAEKKDKLENAGEGKVIFAYEESYGYMLGDYVRDKDAVTAALSLTEMAAWYAGQGMTLYDALLACYEKYGYYGEKTLNLVMPGLDGLKKMADLMANLREKPPVEIAGVGVLQQKDYKDGSVVNVADGAKSTMELSGSNVLRYEMADGTSLIVRPSGTEPKVKVYILANDASREACDAKVAKYAVWAESLKK